jgi:hypothetical protein
MIFVGDGHFSLKPVTELDAEQLKRVTSGEAIDEDFSEVVFRFSDEPHKKFLAGFGQEVPGGAAGGGFERWKELVRKRGKNLWG